MNIGELSQENINKNIEYQKQNMTKQEVEDCNIGLSSVDKNNDGKTSGIEMYKKWSETCSSIFEGNSIFQQRGEEISVQIGELYSRYAGNDGYLDEYEYNAALQSDEMGVLLQEYWEMCDIVDAQNGEDVFGLGWYDSNCDGDVSSVEVYKKKTELYSKKYDDNKEKSQKADEIAQKQAEILRKFEGDDGVLSAEEYAEALRSSEYKRTISELQNLN